MGGQVTSAVVWCWMAAIMRKTHDPENPYSFVCSGTLVERDLVVTTASCASRWVRMDGCGTDFPFNGKCMQVFEFR